LPRANSLETAPKRPLIGITERLNAEDTFYLRRYYTEAVEAAGGIPVHIPLIPNREYLAALCDRLDGLVLSGSNSDLDPAFYGEEPHPKLGTVIPERDEVDLALLEIAERRVMPVLGICFGMQSLNVARGGSLVQDIETQVVNPIKHDQGQVYDRPSHQIEIESSSLLAQLAGDRTVRVNSSHHQAVKNVGRNLRVIARATDGVIEAIVDTRADRFVLGVQWHPEIGWRRDRFSQAIFSKFVEASAHHSNR
jgi:putative glutamine amidotransferase